MLRSAVRGGGRVLGYLLGMGLTLLVLYGLLLLMGVAFLALEPLLLTSPLWVGAGVGLFFLYRVLRSRLTRRSRPA